MSIFEYDEEVHMSFVRAEGVEQGRNEGEIIKIISLTMKKLARGNTIAEIADMLEESETVILKITELITDYPQKSAEELAEIYLEK